MCVPVGYEAWAFYSIAAALTAVYFFLLVRILRFARAEAVDLAPYRGSIFLIGLGAHRLAGFKVHPLTAEGDLRLFGKTRRRLAFLSLGCSVIGVAVMVATLHCHMLPRKTVLSFLVGVAMSVA